MIRRALFTDRLHAVRMAKAFHAVSGAPFRFNAPSAEDVFLRFVEASDKLVLILDEDGPKGILVAEAADHPFAPFRIAREVMWWVDKAARGAETVKMLDAYEAWAREQGCTLMHMACLGTDPVLARLYRKRGLAPAETHFLKAL